MKHAYNRKCKVVMVKFGPAMIYCNRSTKAGRLYCQKHRAKSKVSPPRVIAELPVIAERL